MSSNKRIARKKIESAKSLAANFVTEETNIQNLDNVGYLIECSGITANEGIFTVEVKIQVTENQESEWSTLTLDSSMILANADNNFVVYLNQLPFTHVRIRFTTSSSTDGIADIFIMSKGV